MVKELHFKHIQKAFTTLLAALSSINGAQTRSLISKKKTPDFDGLFPV
jgi:hypothetical protein